MNALELADLLSRHRFNAVRELELQDAIAEVLERADVAYAREVTIAGGRIDFMAGRVGIEVKVRSSLAALTRQVYAYLEAEDLDELLVVTTLHRLALEDMRGKRVVTVHVGGGLL